MNKNVVRSVVATLAVVALITGLWVKSAYYVGTGFVRVMLHMIPFTVTVLVPAILAIVLTAVAIHHWHSGTERRWDGGRRRLRPRTGRETTVAIITTVAVLIPLVWVGQGVRWQNRYGYETHNIYAADMVEVNGLPPAYDLRLSVPQARMQLRAALSGVQGTLGDVAYIGNAPDGPEYCATVERADTLGRIWTRSVICLDPESGSTRMGDFDGNVGTPEGRWASRLGDQVASVQRGLVFDDDDVYGYLTADGEPRLVVPVRQNTGSWNKRYDMPAGVVMFDADGTRTHLDHVEIGEIPGPVFPMSFAAKAVDAANTRNGFVAYRRPHRNDAAVELTNLDGGSAATDPNAENPSEFVLVREDGRLVYVTPVTPYGTSMTVVGYIEVVADEIVAGEAAQATFYRLPADERTASWQLIVQRVTSLYDADIEWMDSNDAVDSSNRARIYELTPAEPGVVTLTIGTGTQTLYRVFVDATLDANNAFGDICIHRFRTGELIRCDSSTGDPAPVGSLRGITGRTSSTAGTTDVDVNLADVPTDELLAELARRIDG